MIRELLYAVAAKFQPKRRGEIEMTDSVRETIPCGIDNLNDILGENVTAERIGEDTIKITSPGGNVTIEGGSIHGDPFIHLSTETHRTSHYTPVNELGGEPINGTEVYGENEDGEYILVGTVRQTIYPSRRIEFNLTGVPVPISIHKDNCHTFYVKS